VQTIEFLLFSTLVAATPLLMAAIGELVTESTGVLNLSVEGMMAIGAAVAFAVAYNSGFYWPSLLAGAAAGGCSALAFAILVLVFRANQTAAGIAMGILFLGISAMIGRPYEGLAVLIMPRLEIPLLSEIPVLGKGVLSQNVLVYLTLLGAIGVYWVLRASRIGLIIRSVGENPEAAALLGYRVRMIQLAATCFGGVMAGLAGGFISVASTPLWVDGMIGGRGWMVIALIVFGTWRIGHIAIGALLFGFIENLDFLIQARGVMIPTQVLTSLPYVATILAIAVISTNTRLTRLYAPRTLGQTNN
jgi:simple sugar transport system permease protein